LDQLDEQIVRLLNERTRHVLSIGEIKMAAGEEIYAPHRERAVFERVCARNSGPMTDEQLRTIYREIMSSALALEKTMTIAYLGPEATFTHQASIKRFGSSLTYAAAENHCRRLHGGQQIPGGLRCRPRRETPPRASVTHTLDMFVDSELKIVSQIVLRVQQCLMSNSPRTKITKLFVHPQSYAQCRGWIQTNLPHVEIIETSSNARSAELAAKEKGAAAIGGILVSEKYKLRLLNRTSRTTPPTPPASLSSAANAARPRATTAPA